MTAHRSLFSAAAILAVLATVLVIHGLATTNFDAQHAAAPDREAARATIDPSSSFHGRTARGATNCIGLANANYSSRRNRYQPVGDLSCSASTAQLQAGRPIVWRAMFRPLAAGEAVKLTITHLSGPGLHPAAVYTRFTRLPARASTNVGLLTQREAGGYGVTKGLYRLEYDAGGHVLAQASFSLSSGGVASRSSY